MSPRYGELQPTNSWDWFRSLGHPSKFQLVSSLDFVTPPTLLNGGQQNFAGCLSVSWGGTLYIHFGGSCPLTEFCQLQNSLCVQVSHSPIPAALLHGSIAAAISQTLWHGTRNGIMELLQMVPPLLGWQSSRWALAHILVNFYFGTNIFHIL